MPKIIRALIKSDLLVWGRQYARLNLDDAARRIGVDSTQLQTWEEGKALPTIVQLHKVAHIYRLPFAFFYLPNVPPKDLLPLRDYRKLPDEKLDHVSYELASEIHQAISKREIALELYEEKEEIPPLFTLTVSLADDADTLGHQLRNIIGVTYNDQLSWRNASTAFSHWREKIERAGVLVFQATDVGISEMRGFSVSSLPLPLIVVNRKDAYQGRIFTSLHELTHIALRTSGLCDLDPDRSPTSEQERIEIFCNRVAAAMLIPKQNLLQEEVVLRKAGSPGWTNDEILKLATIYGASREAIVRRLLTLGLTTEDFYKNKRFEYNNEIRKSRKKGFLPPAKDVVSASGKPFVRLVVESFNSGRITSSDFSDYLGVRFTHLEKISREIGMA